MREATSKTRGSVSNSPRQDRNTAAALVCQTQLSVEIGGRVQTRRLLLGMDQQALADGLDRKRGAVAIIRTA